MWPPRFALLASCSVSLAAAFACGATDDDPIAYPAPEVAASCVTSPTLCGLTLHDLGGGDHPNAFHIVLIGDGYLADEQPLFEWHANSLANTIQHPDEVFATTDIVTRAPELFHFWRIDVPSDSIEVDDSVLTNTPLGAHLGPPDNCQGSPLIRAIEDRFAVALDHATLVPVADDDEAARWRSGRADQGAGDLRADEVRAWAGAAVTSARATFVLLSHRSSGRANATPGGNVRLSSSNNTDTMAHELGHALFRLADEYTEFSTCDIDAGAFTCGPPPDISEAHLLERANTSTLHDGAKWSNDVDGSWDGGNRWPCHAHPTDSCLMLNSAGALCPACASAVEERFARRRCHDDQRPPRVAIEKEPAIFGQGTRALVAASAFDERALGSASLDIAWTLDGAPLSGVRGPFALLDLATIAGREVRATASDGHFTQASSPVALPSTTFVGDEEDAQELTLSALRVGGTMASTFDANTGEVVQFVDGVGARVAVGMRPNDCTRVVRAGATVRVNDGPVHEKDISLPVPLRVGCVDGPSTLFLTFEPSAMADPGDTIEVRGFVVDGKNRRAETAPWRPALRSSTACELDVDASRVDGSALPGVANGAVLGAFDPIVMAVTSDVLDVNVRVDHAVAGTMWRGNDVVVMPIGLPTSTGDAIEVDLLGLCVTSVNGDDRVSWSATSMRVDVAWDNEPPAIAVQTSIAPLADAWEIAVVDDSAIDNVTVALAPLSKEIEDGASEPLPAPLVLTSPPWRVSPVPLGDMIITATDAAGNKATRVVEVQQQDQLDRDVVCPVGDAR